MPQSMVHIENLVKRYGDLTALNHLELDIREGEIFGLLGPNGSGKTSAICANPAHFCNPCDISNTPKITLAANNNSDVFAPSGLTGNKKRYNITFNLNSYQLQAYQILCHETRRPAESKNRSLSTPGAFHAQPQNPAPHDTILRLSPTNGYNRKFNKNNSVETD